MSDIYSILYKFALWQLLNICLENSCTVSIQAMNIDAQCVKLAGTWLYNVYHGLEYRWTVCNFNNMDEYESFQLSYEYTSQQAAYDWTVNWPHFCKDIYQEKREILKTLFYWSMLNDITLVESKLKFYQKKNSTQTFFICLIITSSKASIYLVRHWDFTKM